MSALVERSPSKKRGKEKTSLLHPSSGGSVPRFPEPALFQNTGLPFLPVIFTPQAGVVIITDRAGSGATSDSACGRGKAMNHVVEIKKKMPLTYFPRQRGEQAEDATWAKGALFNSAAQLRGRCHSHGSFVHSFIHSFA